MSTLLIEGGRPLFGAVDVEGNKNAALPLLAACLLTPEEMVLNNVPMIADVLSMAELLRVLGAEVEIDREHDRVRVRAREIVRTDAPPHLFKATRASVVVTGPMLARMGEISFYMPGGDQIGKRPIDMHLRGFQRMGTEIIRDAEGIEAKVASCDGMPLLCAVETVLGDALPKRVTQELVWLSGAPKAGAHVLQLQAFGPHNVLLAEARHEFGG